MDQNQTFLRNVDAILAKFPPDRLEYLREQIAGLGTTIKLFYTDPWFIWLRQQIAAEAKFLIGGNVDSLPALFPKLQAHAPEYAPTLHGMIGPVIKDALDTIAKPSEEGPDDERQV